MSDDQTKEGGLERLLHVLCDLSAAFGWVILVAMAGMTVVSVVGRAFFEHPILGDVELVQLGCAVVVAAFLPYAQFKRANIIVDFFTTRASAPSHCVVPICRHLHEIRLCPQARSKGSG